jgi:hypothetical protein
MEPGFAESAGPDLVGLALLDAAQQVFDHPVEPFPLLGTQLEELHAEIVSGCPGDFCLVHLDRLFQGWQVYTQRQ